MPLQIPALAAGLFAVALAAVAAAKDEARCAVNIEQVKADAAKLGIQVEGGVKPLQRGTSDPQFSKIAEALEMEGEVVVLMIIGGDGAIADQVVLCAEPYGYFEPTVLPWSKTFRFAPLPASAKPYYRGYFLTARFRFR